MDKFRAACDAVFDARQSKRKEEDGRKNEHRHALQELCAQLEQLALAADKEDQELRRALRDLQDQWKQKAGASSPDLRDLESRFTKARGCGGGDVVGARPFPRSRGMADPGGERALVRGTGRLVRSGGASAPLEAESVEAQSAAQERWAALPALPAAWEKKCWRGGTRR